MSILNNLPHTCAAKKRHRIADPMGGFVDYNYTTIFTDRKCWRQPVSDNEIRQWQSRGIQVSHKVYFTSDPGVDETCVLVMGSDTMDVISYAYPDATLGMSKLWRVMVNMIAEPVA